MTVSGLRRLTVSEAVVAFQLVVLVGAAEIALRLFAFGRVVGCIRRGAARPWAAYLPVWKHRVTWPRLIVLTDAAVRLWCGKDGCLRRGLVLLWLTVSEGQAAELVIGVGRTPETRFPAHAWIEVDNQPIKQDLKSTHRYIALSRH